MSDYTPVESNFTAKDTLAVGDPEKLVLGADLDAEFSALQTAIATKYDLSDLATQAQAEAGTNNTQFMSPLRVAQYLGQNSGALVDIIALTDPGADRILFWDESVNAVTWLTVGSGLDITATTLTASAAAIDHDALLNFVANEHINHTSVTITAGVALAYSSGGTDISASATLDVDVTELAAETIIDVDADYVLVYDASAVAHVKMLANKLVGDALGDGKWYRSSTQALSSSTEATIAFNAEEYDALERGTFNTTTGEYTVGAAATRVQVTAQVLINTMPTDHAITIKLQNQGVSQAENNTYHFTGTGANGRYVGATVNISCAAADVIRIRALPSASAMTVGQGTAATFVCITELS